MRELQTDVSLRVSDTDSTDAFEVCGRGELHLSILIENMRRQGYEFAVSKPRVIYREIDGVKCEPIERLVVDTPQASAGAVIEKSAAAAVRWSTCLVRIAFVWSSLCRRAGCSAIAVSS